jgi:superfamily I DNA/RNA helicase
LKERALNKLSNNYLIEEFDWIIDGRGLSSIDEYLNTPRTGRKVPFRESLRESVWKLYLEFKQAVQKEKMDRFGDIRLQAYAIVQKSSFIPQYDFLVVDEVQDLSPVTCSLLTHLVRSEKGIFFAADNKQSIYSKNYQWASDEAKLDFRGRSSLLKLNYRSTTEIDKAAFSILEPQDEELLERSDSIHSGPMPVLLKNVVAAKEGEWAAKYIRQMAKHLRLKINASAVLVPTKKIGDEIEKALKDSGIQAKYYAGRDLDLNADVVKVITLHSAKGLEFPIIVICGLDPSNYPIPASFPSEEIYQEQMNQYRRLLYVGMTRAMRGLMVIEDQNTQNEIFLNMDHKNWHVEEIKK